MSAEKFLSGIPIIGGFFDDSEEKTLEQLEQNQALWGGLDVPMIQHEEFIPEEYQYAGDYSPEEAQSNLISEDPRLKSAQMDYLGKLSNLSDQGLSEVDDYGFLQARQNAAGLARQNREAAMQNAQARGMSGGGLEMALKAQGDQEAATRAQNAGLNQAAESARMRALYNQAYGGALGGVRDQDYRANAANSDILNQFNMYNTTNSNQGQLRNLDARQGVANQNTGTNNQAQLYNQQGARDVQQQNFDNQSHKIQGQTGANTSMAGGYAAQNASRGSDRNANTELMMKAIQGAAGG